MHEIIVIVGSYLVLCHCLTVLLTEISQDETNNHSIEVTPVTNFMTTSCTSDSIQDNTPDAVVEISSSPVCPTDIGELVNANMSADDVAKSIGKLTTDQKYYLLRHHYAPTQHFIFPVMYLAGNNRSFQRAWLDEYSWLVYSEKLDGAFCLPCTLCVKSRTNLGVLVNKPFTKWHKKSEVLKEHAKCLYHLDAVEAAYDVISSCEKPQGTLPLMVNCRKEANMQRNREILRCIAESVLLCGRQCIGLRGDGESSSSGNPGNFMAVLRVIANHNETLREHLDQPIMKNAK